MSQTVCTYWLKGLCMKGESCGFLHEWNPERMPVCRTLLKHGVCREPDCPYKHSLEEIKVTCLLIHLHAGLMALRKPLQHFALTLAGSGCLGHRQGDRRTLLPLTRLAVF